MKGTERLSGGVTTNTRLKGNLVVGANMSMRRFYSTAKPIRKFDFALYYKLVEKITVQDGKRLIITLHEGAEIECEFK